MANIVDQYELDGLREDFKNLLGIHEEGGVGESFDDAKTLGMITRITDPGTLNEATGVYDNPVSAVIYSGPAHMSPVTFRRDRQEIGGQEAVRIRQYRLVLPWDSGDVRIDDFWTVSFSADPELAGRAFDVTDVMYESELAARRVTLTDTSRNPGTVC